MRPSAEGAPPARILIVDDSDLSRAAMARMLASADGIEVIGTARNGEEALREALQLEPDLVVLDLNMPRMDGFTFLRILMARRVTPVVVVSSQSRRSDVFKALELGALDFVAKPEGAAPIENIREALLEKCGLLRSLRIENLAPRVPVPDGPFRVAGLAEPRWVVAIGASTGGPQAIQRLLSELPGDVPAAFLVAQHMPERFTATFAERLARTTPFSVQQAAEGDVIAAGRVLVAPGGHDLEVRRDRDGTLRAAVLDGPGPGVRRPCPSVDRLFASVAAALGERAWAVVLTGMGQDGCCGIAEVKQRGGVTLAESAETAVVYGMPNAAAASGGASEVLALPQIAARIARLRKGG